MASVPAEVFEAAIESDAPPTVTALDCGGADANKRRDYFYGFTFVAAFVVMFPSIDGDFLTARFRAPGATCPQASFP